MSKTGTKVDRHTKIQILHNIKKDKYDKFLAVHRAKLNRLSVTVYNTLFTPAERKAMRAAPDGWLLQPTGIRTNVENDGQDDGDTFINHHNRAHVLTFPTDGRTFPFPYKYYTSNRNYQGGVFIDLDKKQLTSDRNKVKPVYRKQLEAYELLIPHVVAYQEWTDNWKVSIANAEKFMRPCRTVESLLKKWPEVESYIPENIQVANKLPAVQVREVNKGLGLP